MCECYKIGGPWITYDPDCPVHGVEAQQRQREADDEYDRLEARLAEMEQRLAALEEVINNR